MKYEKKFLPQEQQETSAPKLQSQDTIHEFASPEDILRFDAKRTPLPDRVAQRLSCSLQNVPPLSRPWWKQWFS